jgi:hypothetical protein
VIGTVRTCSTKIPAHAPLGCSDHTNITAALLTLNRLAVFSACHTAVANLRRIRRAQLKAARFNSILQRKYFFAWQVPKNLSSLMSVVINWQVRSSLKAAQTHVSHSRRRAGWEETTMDLTARLNWAAAMASFVFVAAIILGLV